MKAIFLLILKLLDYIDLNYFELRLELIKCACLKIILMCNWNGTQEINILTISYYHSIFAKLSTVVLEFPASLLLISLYI